DFFVGTRIELVHCTGDWATLVPRRTCHCAGRPTPSASGRVVGHAPCTSHHAARPTCYATVVQVFQCSASCLDLALFNPASSPSFQ
ncbi:hypothetical protein HAX54_015400, partial [Datura stramonium]|nr:hypothetical protein [Datura stramonium]